MKLFIAPKYSAARNFIASIPKHFDAQGVTLYHSRNIVKSYDNGWGRWVVKKYKKPNIFQRIAYTIWRPSKAKRAFLFADRLTELGFDTPHGVACIEMTKMGFFSGGYFISEHCAHPAVFNELVEKESFDTNLADSLATFLVSLHEKGVLHGDLNLNNILYHNDDNGDYHFTLIDTNRSLFLSSPSQTQCVENLKRVTHRRDLLNYIVERYATIRQWNADDFTRQVIDALEEFEHKRERKRKLKRILMPWRK